MTSARLQRRLNQRRASLAHHSAEFKRHRRKNRWAKAKWHRREIKRDKRAIKKLIRLLKIAKAREARQIDWNGCPALSDGNVKKCIRVAHSAHPDLFLTATTNGLHAPTSWHYHRMAFDAGSSGRYGEEPERRAQQKLLDTFGPGFFKELFGPLPWYVKNGVIYRGVFPGHADHLHCAPVAA